MDASLVLSVGFGVFAICAGLAFFAKYQRHEKEKLELGYSIQRDDAIADLQAQLATMTKSNENYRYRLNRLARNYDVDFDDEELPDGPQNELLPAAMDLIGSKLPPAVKPILNNPTVMKSLVDVVAKNPDILQKVMGLFAKPDAARPASVSHGI